MFRKVGQLRYGRAIRAKGSDLGIPYQTLDPLIKLWKISLNPTNYLRRKRALKSLLPIAPDNPFILNTQQAYSSFGRRQVKNIDAILEECEAIYRHRSSGIDLSDPKNHFRHSLLDADNLSGDSAILELAFSRDLVGAAASYLGAVPILGAVQLWWTPRNELLEGSQYYHIDQADMRQVKVFLNVRKVSTENGPLTFLPAVASKKVFQATKDPYARLHDEVAHRIVSSKEAVQIVGAAGDGAVVDSSRCYHYGGRARSGDRLVVMIQYFPYHCVKETSDLQWLSVVNRLKQELDKEGTYRDLLLQLPPTPF